MRRELDETLCAKYPEIFRDRHESAKITAMCWGFDCGDGWYTLIDCLCEELVRVSKNACTDVPRALQVKEKWGGLRFYATTSIEQHETIIEFAEAMSTRICEVCGDARTARVRGEKWFKTTCDTCAQMYSIPETK